MSTSKVLLLGLSTGEHWDDLTPVCVLRPNEVAEVYRRATFIARMTRRWNHMTREPVDEVVFLTQLLVDSERRVRSAVLGEEYDEVPYGDLLEDAPQQAIELSNWLAQPEEPLIVEADLEALNAYLEVLDPDDDGTFRVESTRVHVNPEPFATDGGGPDFRLDVGVRFRHHDHVLYTVSGFRLSLLRGLVAGA